MWIRSPVQMLLPERRKKTERGKRKKGKCWPAMPPTARNGPSREEKGTAKRGRGEKKKIFQNHFADYTCNLYQKALSKEKKENFTDARFSFQALESNLSQQQRTCLKKKEKKKKGKKGEGGEKGKGSPLFCVRDCKCPSAKLGGEGKFREEERRRPLPSFLWGGKRGKGRGAKKCPTLPFQGEGKKA